MFPYVTIICTYTCCIPKKINKKKLINKLMRQKAFGLAIIQLPHTEEAMTDCVEYIFLCAK